MAETPRTGRPKHFDARLIVNINDALDAAINAKVKAMNEAAEKAGKIDRVDRSAIVRACLAKCLAAELREVAQQKPAASKP